MGKAGQRVDWHFDADRVDQRVFGPYRESVGLELLSYGDPPSGLDLQDDAQTSRPIALPRGLQCRVKLWESILRVKRGRGERGQQKSGSD